MEDEIDRIGMIPTGKASGKGRDASPIYHLCANNVERKNTGREKKIRGRGTSSFAEN